jgi:hypothetical protein
VHSRIPTSTELTVTVLLTLSHPHFVVLGFGKVSPVSKAEYPSRVANLDITEYRQDERPGASRHHLGRVPSRHIWYGTLRGDKESTWDLLQGNSNMGTCTE